MAYAFTNLNNLAGGDREQKAQQPQLSGGAVSSNVGQTQTQQAAPSPATSGAGAGLARQVAANQDVLQSAQTRATENIGRIAGQGRQQIAEAASAYQKENAPQAAPSASFVRGAVRTGREADLAKLNELFTGAGPDVGALDVAPEAANQLGSILTGGGAQYLTKQLGGFGLLENLLSRQGGSLVQQRAEEAGRQLGTEAETTEKTATEQAREAAKTGREAAQKNVRDILAGLRGEVGKTTTQARSAELSRKLAQGNKEKAELEKQAMAQIAPELDRLYGTTGAGLKAREAAMPQVRAVIRDAIKRVSNPEIGAVVTQSQADQLGRIASLIGGTAPTATPAGNYAGQFQLDPNLVQNLVARLFPKTPTGPDLPRGATGIPQPGQLILPGGEDYEPIKKPIVQMGQFDSNYNPLASIM